MSVVYDAANTSCSSLLLLVLNLRPCTHPCYRRELASGESSVALTEDQLATLCHPATQRRKTRVRGQIVSPNVEARATATRLEAQMTALSTYPYIESTETLTCQTEALSVLPPIFEAEARRVRHLHPLPPSIFGTSPSPLR